MSNFNNINYGQPQIPVASTVPVQGGPQQYAPPVQQPYAPQQYAPQPSYGVDQTRFNSPQPMPAPAPAVEVGFFDKVKSYFQDVYRSPENLQAYKQFQTQVDSDPNTIKPGSNDRNRVQDLQQKLQLAGVQVNVNGVYGYATGEAVKQFKQQMNINDGFLNGQGQPAITDIATPQMISVLDSVVTKSLNPQLPGTGNPMPVTQEELLWAQNLATRIQHFGYQPNQQEQNRYNDIFARQQQQQVGGMPAAPQPSPTVPNTPIPGAPPVYQQPTAPTGVVPVSQQELDWAMAMQDRIVNTGYRPTPQEAAAYEDIQQRYAAQQQNAAPAPQLGSGPVTQDELNWLRAQSGKQLSGNDLARYQNITERYLAQQNSGQVAAPQPAGQLMPVTQDELNWALDLQNKIQTQNYQPTPDEVAKYKDIFNRYESQGVDAPAPAPAYKPGETPAVAIDNKVSQAELDWAVDLQARVDQGYQPTHHEIARYTDIFNRYEASQKPAEPTPAPAAPTTPGAPSAPTAPVTHPGATQTDVQWARAFENRIAQGQKGTPDEIARYNTIQMKLANYGMAPPAEPTVATTAPGAPLTQADIDWAMQLQHRVQYQGYQPTQAEIDRYTDIYNRQQAPAPAAQQPAAPVAPAAPTAPQQPAAPTAPSAEDIQWAQQLQTAVQQGYQASEAEIARFTDIYNRLQASQGQPQAPAQQPAAPSAPVAPVAPAQQTPPGSVMINTGTPDHELQWALELLNRYRQGYQPSPSELAMYESIIAKKAVPGATP